MDPKVRAIFEEMETLAEDILTEKQQVIEYDAKRQANREALSILTKNKNLEGKKLFMWTGSTFIKLPTASITDIIRKEQQTIDKEMEELNKTLKEKTNRLYYLQGEKEKVMGYNLQALDRDDLNFLNLAK